MTAALTPDLALDYLGQLSVDIRAAVVLDATGAPLAGDAALAGPARALLDAGDGPEVEVLSAEGGVFAARSDTHAVAVRTSPLALAGVVRLDLRTVLDALG